MTQGTSKGGSKGHDTTKVYSLVHVHAMLQFNWDNLDERLEERDTGLWVRPLAKHDASRLFPAELADMMLHPGRDHAKPALPARFTLDDFIVFEHAYGLVTERYEAVDGGADPDKLEKLAACCEPAAELVRAVLDGTLPDGTALRAPPGKKAAQENALLRWLREHGHDPLNLPEADGRAGAKAEAKRALVVRGASLFRSDGVLDDAWERLMRDGRLRRAGNPPST